MSVYLAAEIGQNHQGSVETAKDLIHMVAHPKVLEQGIERPVGFDAVKLCLRDNDHEGTRAFMDRDYQGRQSFGETYREHREMLELSDDEVAELADYARKQRLDVGLTVCHPSRLSVLDVCEPDWLKVASRDLSNTRLLKALARTGLPLVISTGMADQKDLDRALDAVYQAGDPDVTVLHCVSSYPTEASDVNLRSIRYLRRHYNTRVGFSDHTVGVWAGPAAVAMGATWLEKHVTLYRGMRGSDHEGALGPEGVWRYTRDVRETERAIGENGIFFSEAAEDAQRKLERSVAYARDLPEGHKIEPDDLEPLSPGTGIRWPRVETVVGERLARDVEAQTLAKVNHLAEPAPLHNARPGVDW